MPRSRSKKSGKKEKSLQVKKNNKKQHFNLDYFMQNGFDVSLYKITKQICNHLDLGLNYIAKKICSKLNFDDLVRLREVSNTCCKFLNEEKSCWIRLIEKTGAKKFLKNVKSSFDITEPTEVCTFSVLLRSRV